MSPDRAKLQQALAALGVIASLAFVGWEIRQNTAVARAAAVQGISEQIIQWQTEMIQDEHWVRIMTFLGNGGTYAELSPEDQIRYQWVVSATVRIMENRFRQMQMGIISEDDLAAGGGAANTWWFRSEHFLDAWRSRDQSIRWTPEFLEFMETDILGIR